MAVRHHVVGYGAAQPGIDLGTHSIRASASVSFARPVSGTSSYSFLPGPWYTSAFMFAPYLLSPLDEV